MVGLATVLGQDDFTAWCRERSRTSPPARPARSSEALRHGSESGRESGETALAAGGIAASSRVSPRWARSSAARTRSAGWSATARSSASTSRRWGSRFRLAGVLALLSLVVLMGGAVRDALDLGEAFDSVWRIARWPLGVAFAVASVALLFEYSPRRRQPEASWLAFGAGVSAILWLLFMAGLALYMDATDSFGATYGPIAGTIGVLL